MNQKEILITEILIEAGANISHSGFVAIRDAVILVDADNSISQTKIYKVLADRYECAPMAIERRIRHAVSQVNKDKANKLFNNGFDGKNGNFIRLVHYEMERRLYNRSNDIWGELANGNYGK